MALYTSILTGGVNNHTTTSEEANSLATDFVSDGVIGDITSTSSVAPMTGAFAVNAQGTPDMTVAVTAGAAYITATPSGQSSQVLRIKLSANQNVTIAANSSGSTKYDYLYIKVDPTNAANPNLAGDDVASLVVSRSTSNSTDNGTPPTYGYLIAVITVANGASSITNGNIRDIRVKSEITGNSSSISTGWVTGTLPAVNSVTDNGNNSYTLNFSSAVDSILSEGMRVRTTRNSAAGITCFSLDGSNDYLNDTTVSGMTFTDDFTVSAWIYLTSYAAVNIVSRYNGTSGWTLYLTASGQVVLQGYNGGSGNNSYVNSYQSVPLNKWVHVAAQLDMSTFTATTTTSYVMINGKDVPASVARSGTNPTALIQAGNLEIGSQNGGTNPFPGYIKDVAIYNSKITQATIAERRNQPLTGSEANLISAYSGANTTDLNATNANNLTAQNGAVTGFASAPWGNRGLSSTLDYGLVMAVSGSTATVQVPEGCTICTTGGVSAVAYSVMASPFGFVSDKGRWEISVINRTNTTVKASPTSATWYNIFNLAIPTGNWAIANKHFLVAVSGGVAYLCVAFTLSTGAATENNSRFTARTASNNQSQTENNGAIYSSGFISNSTMTTYYLNLQAPLASTTSIAMSGSVPNGDGVTSAIPAGL